MTYMYCKAVDMASAKDSKSFQNSKVLRTATLYASFMALGMCEGITGPTLLDLMDLLGASIEGITWGISAFSLGFLMGACFSGYLVDRALPSGVVSLTIIIMAVSTPLIPAMPNLPGYIAISCVLGTGCGMMESAANVILVKMWGERHEPYLQALHFFFGIGAAAVPLFSKPFLSKKTIATENGGNKSHALDIGLHGIETTNFTSFVPDETNNTLQVHASKREDSKVLYPYLIVGLVCVAVSICAVFFFIADTRNERIWQGKQKVVKVKNEERRPNQRCRRNILLILTFFFYMFYMFTEEVCTNLLTTFAVKELNWSKSDGALLSAVFWGSNCFAGALAIMEARFMTPKQMQIANLTMGLIATTLLATLSRRYPVIAWPACSVLGGSVASIFPTQISWTEEQLGFTGSVSSIALLGTSIGALAMGPTMGYLIECLGHIVITYVVVISCITYVSLFVSLEIVASCTNPPAETKEMIKFIKKEKEKLEGEKIDKSSSPC